MQTDVDDAKLARRAVAGDQSAADELFARLWPRIRAAAYAISASHALAEEIAQDALETMVGRLGDFRGDAELGTWLTSIVVNRARNVVRHEVRSVPVPDVEAGGEIASSDAFSSDPTVLAAVRRLSFERREVIALRYWLDLRPSEVAVVLGIPVGTVHSRISRAMTELRTELEVEDARV